jgi:hypothetical protein
MPGADTGQFGLGLWLEARASSRCSGSSRHRPGGDRSRSEHPNKCSHEISCDSSRLAWALANGCRTFSARTRRLLERPLVTLDGPLVAERAVQVQHVVGQGGQFLPEGLVVGVDPHGQGGVFQAPEFGPVPTPDAHEAKAAEDQVAHQSGRPRAPHFCRFPTRGACRGMRPLPVSRYLLHTRQQP